MLHCLLIAAFTALIVVPSRSEELAEQETEEAEALRRLRGGGAAELRVEICRTRACCVKQLSSALSGGLNDWCTGDAQVDPSGKGCILVPRCSDPTTRCDSKLRKCVKPVAATATRARTSGARRHSVRPLRAAHGRPSVTGVRSRTYKPRIKQGEDCTEDSECDDEVFCNGEETCVEGTCEAAEELPCPTVEECIESSQRCMTVSSNTQWIVIGVAAGLFLLVLICICVFIFIRRRPAAVVAMAGQSTSRFSAFPGGRAGTLGSKA